MNTSVDPLTLPSLPLSQTADLPETLSVYFVLDGDEVMYIGRSVKLRQRWNFSRSHHVLPKLLKRTKMRIAWLECSDSELTREIETALINHFNPPLNIRVQSQPSGKPRTNLGVAIDPDVKGQLKNFAESKHWSMSQAAEILIKEGLERAGIKIKGDEEAKP